MGNTQSCRARKGVVLVVALALGSAGRARAATYTAIDLYTLALPAGNNSFFLGGKPQTAAPGGKVVGNGTAGNNAHALLWNGTAVATDLNPTNLGGITNSNANGTSGTQQVGYGSGTGTGNNNHALLWNGTAVATDLNPTNLGVTTSIAYGTSGTQQVGEGSGTGFSRHALLWNGTSVATDLELLLPANFINSTAYSLDASGNVFGTATDTSGATHAVEWVATPEPTSLSLLALSGLALFRHTRRRTV